VRSPFSLLLQRLPLQLRRRNQLLLIKLLLHWCVPVVNLLSAVKSAKQNPPSVVKLPVPDWHLKTHGTSACLSVSEVMEPTTTALVVIHGPQGIGKSTLWSILGGRVARRMTVPPIVQTSSRTLSLWINQP